MHLRIFELVIGFAYAAMEGWEEDMSISSGSSEYGENSDGNYNNLYLDETERPNRLQDDSSADFVTDDFNIKHCNGIDFSYIHNQNMNYYQETQSYYHGSNYVREDDISRFNSTSMLGHIDEPRVNENDPDYDPDFDQEVNKLLEELEEDLGEDVITDDLKDETDPNFECPIKQQYEDYYDDFQHEPVVETPNWYMPMIQKKQLETNARLRNLSSLVCYASISTREQITRIERDHHTPFCKLNIPRHPPLNKPWLNYWRFNCSLKCKVDPPEPNHAHTIDCEQLLFEHVNTGISTKSKNIHAVEFPEYIMRAVEVFQEFVVKTSKDPTYLENNDIPDTVYEKPSWSYIKLRSNYKNEIMLIVCGKGVTPLLGSLKRYYKNGPGRATNVVSLYCINVKWSQKKSQFPPSFIHGLLELRDKVGPIQINYNPRTNINFNSIEAQQLGKIMFEYLAPTAETTIVDIGCNFGVLSLMLAQKCDKVIGLNTQDHEIKMAEDLKAFNKLHNASFIVCTPKEVETKCSSLVKKCISVAVINLATPFGKSQDVMKSLRNLPSIWRVALYGSFSKEFHKHITVLTSTDCNMGDEFLPMQGCILDKSPSIPNAFDIVILFERKSLIEPSIELIASGPTVNVKKDEENYGDFIIRKGKGFGDEFEKPKRSTFKPFPKYARGLKKFGRFDSPSLPKEKDQKPEITPIPKENEPDNRKIELPAFTQTLKIKDLRKIFDSPLLPKSKDSDNLPLPIPAPTESRFDCPSLPRSKDKLFDCSPLYPKKEKRYDCPSFPKKDKRFDCPSLPKKDKRFDCPSLSRKDKRFDCPPLPKKDKQFDCPSLLKQEKGITSPPVVKEETVIHSPPLVKQENIIESSPLIKQEKDHHPLLRVKKERQLIDPLLLELPPRTFNIPPTKFSQQTTLDPSSLLKNDPIDCPPLPQPKLEPPPSPTSLTCPPLPTQPKLESVPPPTSIDCPPHLQAKLEPVPSSLVSDKEEGELSADSDSESPEHPTSVVIKSEPMDLVSDDDFEPPPIFSMDTALSKCEDISSDSNSMKTFPPVSIKTEPIDPAEQQQQQQQQQQSPTIKTETCCMMNPPAPTTFIKTEKISDLDDFENMVTPVHVPAALARRASPQPVPPSTSFTTLDGFEVSVNPNGSFLPTCVKVEPESKAEPPTPEEPLANYEAKANGETDDEISIISVNKVKRKAKEEKDKEKKKEKKRRKSKDKKEKKDRKDRSASLEDSEETDLRKLIEKKKKLQKELDQSSEYPRSRSDRSSSPLDARRRYARSPPRRYGSPPFSRRGRSPSLGWDRRTARATPSPTFRKFKPSPRYNGRRTPSPRYNTRRSPLSPRTKRNIYGKRSRTRSRSPSRPRSRSRSRSPARRRSTKSPLVRRHRSRSSSPAHRRNSHSGFGNDKRRKKIKSPGDSKARIQVSPKDDQWDIPGLSSLSDLSGSSPDKQRRKKIKRESSPAKSTSSLSSPPPPPPPPLIVKTETVAGTDDAGS